MKIIICRNVNVCQICEFFLTFPKPNKGFIIQFIISFASLLLSCPAGRAQMTAADSTSGLLNGSRASPGLARRLSTAVHRLLRGRHIHDFRKRKTQFCQLEFYVWEEDFDRVSSTFHEWNQNFAGSSSFHTSCSSSFSRIFFAFHGF